jgi:VWFA-related protein
MKPVAALALAATLSIVALPSARQAQQSPSTTFRSGTALVEVDIIVKDKDGNFVSGLTSDDFEVLEDGRRQQIQHFYLVTERAAAPNEPRSVVMMPRSPDQTGRRVFVLFFDTEHLAPSGLTRLKQAAMKFVGEQFRPRDLGGVFANGALWHGHLTSDSQ